MMLFRKQHLSVDIVSEHAVSPLARREQMYAYPMNFVRQHAGISIPTRLQIDQSRLACYIFAVSRSA